MPEQPDDPIHYEMKIPPDPQDATLNKDQEQDAAEKHHGPKEATHESNPAPNDRGNNPEQSRRQSR
jgi:hypothetical protein